MAGYVSIVSNVFTDVTPFSLAVLCCRAQPQQQQNLLEQALAEEMVKAARRSGQDATRTPQVQFKQVSIVTQRIACFMQHARV